MDFTREPIIESVLTPKSGCKLVIRSSKAVAQEEFFVDAVEIVSFGHTFFFRSQERPKSFLVPATDYEVLEVRETKMVMKSAVIDKSIKIGGGKKQVKEKKQPLQEVSQEGAQGEVEVSPEKKKERRRPRRRREKEAEKPEAKGKAEQKASQDEKLATTTPSEGRALLPPPSTLISETIQKYHEDAMFKEIFHEVPGGQEEFSAGEEEDEKPLIVPVTSEKDTLFDDDESKQNSSE